ncbi:S4 domain-containing protein [Herbaspirillum sp. RTI4]|uniref:RNA-binding S4 domain-containing protein n=1 Tax=Herbaspirillum sp. RTI4 TaxID=3048640 RepID=UPI002AB5760D|nr:S4 domain-containing protein [Herbaspirillum sp. RTI4]MDY7577120.1 S4 domain-containing protein [Herbaspirillum sp. RTI4]MEA9982862.1 S4 domain-containing protein [Herbaspirillum sp. RTI4]
MSDSVRIDKWLWAARFFKTRSLAAAAIDDGKVRLHEERIKPAHKLRIDDKLQIDNDGNGLREVLVLGLSDQRGAASIAQTLYAESAASIARREKLAEQRRWFPEPAAALKGRPTKRDRRLLDKSLPE